MKHLGITVRFSVRMMVMCVGWFMVHSPMASALTISGETATASSAYYSGLDPSNAVNDSALTNVSGIFYHWGSGNPNYRWLTVNSNLGQTDTNPWYTVDLGAKYSISSYRVWNYNESGGTMRGVSNAFITYSLTNSAGTGTTLATNVFTIGDDINAPGEPGDLFVPATPFQAQYVRFNILNNFTGIAGDGYGFSEVQFYGVALPEPSTWSMLGLGLVGLLCRQRWAGRRFGS